MPSSRDRWTLAASAVVVALCAIAISRELTGWWRERHPAAAVPTVATSQPDGLSYEVYVPVGLDATRKHPLVVGGSPDGVGRTLVAPWRGVCDRFGWILMTTDNFRNGPYIEKEASFELKAIARVRRDYPIDETRIYAAGMSGAGMHAHDLIEDHPDIFRGIIVNTGMMPRHMAGNQPVDAAHYPRHKQAVFLASPTDFRFEEMKQDRALLEGFGWETAWFEFAGGHRYAPPETYLQAAEWLAAH